MARNRGLPSPSHRLSAYDDWLPFTAVNDPKPFWRAAAGHGAVPLAAKLRSVTLTSATLIAVTAWSNSSWAMRLPA